MSLSLVTWKWSQPGYRSTFTGDHVNRLAAMARRNYRGELRVICVTDDGEGIDPSIEVLPDWRDFESVPSPHGGGAPSCYRRLRGFHPDIAEHFGPRFVVLDLDTVIVRDVTPIWDRGEEFVGLTDPFYPRQLNGGMWLLRAGTRPQVWQRFDPAASPGAAAVAGYRGSDQAWISACLAHEPRWSRDDGVYSYRRDIEATGRLPKDARIVSFHGKTKPWDCRLPWIPTSQGD